MRKSYFIVVVAHSIHGRIRRINIPHYAIHAILCLAVFGAITGMGLVSSYARMLWKVTEFNKLREEKQALQRQYDALKLTVDERNAQLASLGDLATEVSIAFGIKRAGQGDLIGEGMRQSGYHRSLSQFDLLQQVAVTSQQSGSMWQWLENTTPSVWPVRGRLSSSFGNRLDPFLGKGAFHAGVDLAAPRGTPVVAAADGIVASAGWFARYGQRVELMHGRNGLSSVYAHLSEIYARPGQVVRRGEVIGRVGRTGRATSANLHYEVRYRGTPVNPYKYLQSNGSRTVGLAAAD